MINNELVLLCLKTAARAVCYFEPELPLVEKCNLELKVELLKYNIESIVDIIEKLNKKGEE